MIVVLNPLLINRMAGTKTAVALYITLSQILATLAQIVVGRAADRWGGRCPTLVAYSVLVFAIVGQGIFVSHLWSYYTFGVLGIAAAWSLSTLMPVLVAASTDTDERGRVLGTLDMLWNLAMIGGSMLGGALLEIAMGLPFVVVAVLNVAAIVLAASFFRLVQVRKVEIFGVESTI
jgi:MFS family permease